MSRTWYGGRAEEATPLRYDQEQAAAMLAALMQTAPERRLDTLAVVCRVVLGGWLGAERGRR